MKIKTVFLLSCVFTIGLVDAAECKTGKVFPEGSLPPSYDFNQEVREATEKVRPLDGVERKLRAMGELAEGMRWDVGRKFCVEGANSNRSETKNFLFGLWPYLSEVDKEKMVNDVGLIGNKTITLRAFEQGNLALFKETLKRRANPNQEYNETPLVVSLASSNNSAFLKALLKCDGLLIDSPRRSDDLTALMAAVNVPRYSSVKLLLKSGADIGLLNNRNETIKDIVDQDGYGKDDDGRWYNGGKQTKTLITQLFDKRAGECIGCVWNCCGCYCFCPW